MYDVMLCICQNGTKKSKEFDQIKTGTFFASRVKMSQKFVILNMFDVNSQILVCFAHNKW